MKNKKYFLLTFFIIIFSVILNSGCKEKNNSKSSDNENSPVTFTFFSSDLLESEAFNDPIATEITKRTGVSLNFIASKGDPSQDIDIMIANDSYPDFIFAKGDLVKLIESKGVIPLDSYIETYGDNIKKLYGSEIVKLRNSLEDPSIYTVGTYQIKTNTLEVSGNLQIQNAVLREFQYPKIQTLEDYENLLLAYKKRVPYINGHKVIGLSILSDSWYWYTCLSNPGNYVLGYPDDGQWIVDQETMQATYKFLNPDMHKFYKWLNKIYYEDLLDPESFTQDISIWQQKIKDGYVLGTAAPLWLIQELENEMTDNGMAERTYAYMPITYDRSVKDQALKDYGFSGGWGIAISKSCNDKYRAFKFLDWICSEEAQILTNWGIEGQHYYYDEYKIRRNNLACKDFTGVEKWIYPFPQAGNGYVDSTGNFIGKNNTELIKKKYNSAEKDTLKAYGADMWVDLFPTKEELGQSKHGQVWQYSLNSKMTQKINAADDFVKDCLIKMIVGDPENFDKSWKNMQDELIALGINEVEDEITHLIKMKMQLWSQS